MNKDAKIIVSTTAFICLISLFVWTTRRKAEDREITFSKNKNAIAQFSAGKSSASVQNWLKRSNLNFRVTTRKNNSFLTTGIVLNSGVPVNTIDSWISAVPKSGSGHGYQFLFDRKGALLKAWAEDYRS